MELEAKTIIELHDALIKNTKGVAKEALKNKSVFTENMKQAVHRWFKFSAGYSAGWVEEEIMRRQKPGITLNVFDPFVGSGTTLIAAQEMGANSIGVEKHPFIYRIAKAKLKWSLDPTIFIDKAQDVLNRAKELNLKFEGAVPVLLTKCYTPSSLNDLTALKQTINSISDDDEYKELLWLTLASILRSTSFVGTASWQYVLPKQTKSKVKLPFDAFATKIAEMSWDMVQLKDLKMPQQTQVFEGDSRSCGEFAENWADLVITSPPYPNNFDYADATRLEMTFFGEATSWGDLNKSVRSKLMRSASQQMAGVNVEELLESEVLAPIRDDLRKIYDELGAVRLTKGGRKAYHSMIVAYFYDLALTWRELRKVCKKGSELCYVIGDSAPYGVYVPVDKFLIRLAEAEGFTFNRFEKIRDRNIKWKNRKHTVPLMEGNLWLKG